MLSFGDCYVALGSEELRRRIPIGGTAWGRKTDFLLKVNLSNVINTLKKFSCHVVVVQLTTLVWP